MKAVVIYYSFTGNTRLVAEMLARDLGAELVEFTCPPYRGRFGGLRQFWDVFTRGTPEIALPAHAIENHDLVVVAGPVWAARPAPPLRSLVRQKLSGSEKLAAFVTCNGTSKRYPPEKAINEIVAACPSTPVATHIFREAEIKSPMLAAEINAFAQVLRQAAGPAPIASPKVVKISPARH